MANSNAIIIYGGGLVDPSKYVLMRLGKNLSQYYDKIFIGSYSFESLFTPKFIHEYNEELVQEVKGKRGTYFGTCRGIDLCNPTLFGKAINCLKERNICTIVVAGGDGSSRQVAETSDAFKKEGINIIFPIPLTIDGINGGISIGIKEAVAESIRQIENIVSTSLNTRDNGEFGVVIAELQGRNRDDIIANVLQSFYKSQKIADFDFCDILLKVVPANFETDEDKLINQVNNSSKRTLILISEGAKERNKNLSISELTKRINRKVRTTVIGHQSQSNNMTSESNVLAYNLLIDRICCIIGVLPFDSYCLAVNDGSISRQPIDYFAKLNPRKGQEAQLSKYMSTLLGIYMAK